MVCTILLQHQSKLELHDTRSSLPSPLALPLSLSLCVCANHQKNDNIWNNPGGDTNIIRHRVCFTCRSKDQFGSWHAKAMEGDDKTSRSQLSHLLLPNHPKNQDKRCILSHELHHYHIVHSPPQLARAPHLVDRLHHHDGCMVVLILSKWWTIDYLRVCHKWSSGDDGLVANHGYYTFPYQCQEKYHSGTWYWTCGCNGSWRIEGDRWFVLCGWRRTWIRWWRCENASQKSCLLFFYFVLRVYFFDEMS